MDIGAVMSRDVATVSPRTTLLTVGKMMADKKISCVMVTNNNRITGIISERDVVRHLAASRGDLSNLTAGKTMSTPVETLYSDTSIERAVTLMTEKKYRRFPIINRKGRLMGIVTQSDVLKAFVKEMEIAHEKLKDLSIRDYLTGMYNRRLFMSALENEFYRSRRYQTPMSLILADLDDFKDINDRHGHQHGDQVLKTVADVIRKGSRDADIPARFGGEEFVIITPETDVSKARRLAERLRKDIAQFGFTASFGIASYPNKQSRFPDDLIRMADEALYIAKHQGKNKVVCVGDEVTEKKNAKG
jgi:diguanylate cyclase (GGDEF)-like protein